MAVHVGGQQREVLTPEIDLGRRGGMGRLGGSGHLRCLSTGWSAVCTTGIAPGGLDLFLVFRLGPICEKASTSRGSRAVEAISTGGDGGI
ncbi:hypothetical protein ACFFX0_22400 [Citricoccus parietis]|uniref:Uncharacterized protein n=1 Tax=Citricoccus parietis TaxID=592307 RepID=A0ABV5G4D5_9MICC